MNDYMEAYKPIKIATGLLLFVIILFLPKPPSLNLPAWHAIAIITLMVVWWATEAIPLAATAVLPLILFPIFNVVPITKLASSYANPIIFLFLGGFIIALALEKTHLHRRIALRVLSVTGTKPHRIILGFIITSAFFSMWISNTATTVMMLPIALSIIEIESHQKEADKQFGLVLMLSIAYSSSIGGLGTLIGTAPNAFLAAFLAQNANYHIGFGEWMLTAIPLVLLALPILFITLTRFVFKLDFHSESLSANYIQEQLAEMGKLSSAEKRVAIVFLLTVALWLLRQWISGYLPGIHDGAIAIFGAVLLFLIPDGNGNAILNQSSFKQLPWDILLLFGGGLSIALVIKSTGITTWLINYLGFMQHWPVFLIILMVGFIMIFLTEIMSNTAVIATFLPLVAAISTAAKVPVLQLLLPATFAVSCAFMLPIATPPNAIVYSSRFIHIKDMMKAGIILNILLLLLISIYSFLLPYLVSP